MATVVVGLGVLGAVDLLSGPPWRSSGTPGCPVPAPPGPAHIADVDGDGCVDVVLWDAAEATAEVHHASGGVEHFAVGEPGDEFHLGDWDCDGIATPAVSVPDGTAFVFDGWPLGGPLEARPVPRDAVRDHTC